MYSTAFFFFFSFSKLTFSLPLLLLVSAGAMYEIENIVVGPGPSKRMRTFNLLVMIKISICRMTTSVRILTSGKQFTGSRVNSHLYVCVSFPWHSSFYLEKLIKQKDKYATKKQRLFQSQRCNFCIIHCFRSETGLLYVCVLSEFSFLTWIIKNDHVKLIIDFRFPSGEHMAHMKRSIIN